MSRYVFKVPDLGEGTVETEIVAWHVKVGDLVAEDARVEMSTEKAVVEVPCPSAVASSRSRASPATRSRSAPSSSCSTPRRVPPRTLRPRRARRRRGRHGECELSSSS